MRIPEMLSDKFRNMFKPVGKPRAEIRHHIETEHFRLVLDKQFSIQSPDGATIIDDLELSYTTCSLYCIRAPLTGDRKIVLDHLEGIEAGDDIIVAASLYGASAIPTYQFACKVADRGLDFIVVDRDLPAHIMKYSNGLIVLRRSEDYSAAGVGDSSVQVETAGTTISYTLHTPHFDMRIHAITRRDSTRIDLSTTTTFLQPVRLFNLSLILQSPQAISEVFLKNRTRRVAATHPIRSDIWLWKEGARSKTEEYDWMVLGNPDLASTEILTAGRGSAFKTIRNAVQPTLVLNLLHYSAQHYRRHVENMVGDYSFSTFEEHSLPSFNRGDAVNHRFALHAGKRLTSPPRLSHSPKGFRAVHIWTEHADMTCLDSHRAAYFGDQQATSADSAVGGFAYYRHVVTKSVFFDNPGGYQNVITKNGEPVKVGEALSYKRCKEFASFLDALALQGHEICLHALAPNDVVPHPENIAAFYECYRSRTWIDHGMRNVRAAIGWQGFTSFSAYRITDALAASDIRYFWTWPSTDFMSKNKAEINLLHNTKAEFMPTPLYWKHPAMPDGTVIWASHEASLDGFGDDGLDKLIAERGVSIHQHYYPYLIDEKYDFKFIEVSADGKYRATSRFNAVLDAMAKRNREGELLLTTVGGIMNYWLDTEYVEFEMVSDGFRLRNRLDRPINGLAFYVHAQRVSSQDVELRYRALDADDFLVWCDMPAKGTIHCSIEEHHREQ
jgi:hypothetical protein